VSRLHDWIVQAVSAVSQRLVVCVLSKTSSLCPCWKATIAPGTTTVVHPLMRATVRWTHVAPTEATLFPLGLLKQLKAGGKRKNVFMYVRSKCTVALYLTIPSHWVGISYILIINKLHLLSLKSSFPQITPSGSEKVTLESSQQLHTWLPLSEPVLVCLLWFTVMSISNSYFLFRTENNANMMCAAHDDWLQEEHGFTAKVRHMTHMLT